MTMGKGFLSSARRNCPFATSQSAPNAEETLQVSLLESVIRRNELLRVIEKGICGLVSVVGFAVMIGWFFQITSLTSINANLVSMKFNTALCLLFSGLALLFSSKAQLTHTWSLLSWAATTIVFAITTLTLAQYLTGLDIGIDQMFVTDQGSQVAQYSPGRMAPTTAGCLFLLSIALITVLQRRAVGLRSTASITVFIIAFLNLTGYAYDVSDFYEVSNYAAMALHTAASLLGMSLAIMFAEPAIGIIRFINAETTAGLMLRRLIPAIITFPLIFGWLRHFGQTSKLYAPEFGVAVFTVANVLFFSILAWRIAMLIQKLDNEKDSIQRKKDIAESLTQKQEAMVQSIMENVVDAIITIDEQGHIESVNRAATRIFGYERDELMGRNVSILMPEPYRSNHDTYLTNYLKTGHAKILGIGRESMGQRKDGSTFPIDLAVSEFSYGSVRHFSGIIRDITEKKNAESGLRRWKHIFMHAGWAVAVARPEDRGLTEINPAFAKMHGYEVEELIGKQLDILVAPESRDKIGEFIRNADERGDFTYESFRIRKDGTKFPARTHLTTFKDATGKVEFRVGTIQDLTALKKEEASQRAKEAADIANAAKSTFLANMSHEIRTPLGVVLGFSELLANPNLTPSERTNYSAAIKRNGEILSSVINDILDISKVEAGKLDVEKEEVSLADIVNDIATMLNLRALEKGVRLTITSEGPIPRSVTTDSARLRQILLNVVGNAIKFTQNGSVTVIVKQVVINQSLKLAFVVKDTGCGLTEEHKKRLFSAFSQADTSTTRNFGGTGLGLVLARKLANLLGGDVVLTESAPGVGSTFTITIDPGSNAAVLFENFEKHEPPQLSIVPREINLKGVNVLLVEDAPDNQMLLGHILRTAGANVQPAFNGKEALEMAESGNYHIILMDIQMPIMDGYEAIHELRGHGYRKPVLALTAHAMKEERDRCLAAGFDGHMSKPIHRQQLLELVSQYSQQVDRVSVH